jgi:iron complex transport system ATP-binding protein
MAEAEPALETVVSGKYAMIDYWGRVSTPDRARARRLLRQVECDYVADRPWGFLSQGERQRVLIARALMGRPRVLILDEPCAGLDPVAREQFLHFLNRWGRRPRAPTLVLVTHHVEEITPVFSHVLLLQEGRVTAAGAKTAVLNSRRLSEAFGARLRLSARRGRYQLTVSPSPEVVL